ncbi:MAG: BMP family ABC transporter substrate-binding protein [Erysipelotrichaceae bacterium]|nr:BMP family ABC transporter substrate-binding protein [Erysipelotrichaceae bacterium]MBR3226908.1 BMP family ABC transporter substrate-binding protein [Erysipelotrichaceae bacterium]
MKKLFKVIATLLIVLSLVACSGGGEAPADGGEEPAATGVDPVKSVVYITQYGEAAPFTAMCVTGVKVLEQEGWDVKILEVKETSEFADQIRAMAAEGYHVIVTEFDALGEVALQLADELAENYPDLKIFLNDTYVLGAAQTSNCANIICDPWESEFVAGYVAALTTEVGKVAWLGHTDQVSQDRFKYGFEAGVKYANNGTEVFFGYTGDAQDANKGQEAAKAMIAENGVDIIDQAANTSGLGVMTECKEEGIRAIGVDMWQGGDFGQETVFWSALKPINDAITKCCKAAADGTWTGHVMYYDIAGGAAVYDQRDFDLLPADVQEKVTQLMADIASGAVDVYAGYDEYRWDPSDYQ